jgi:hypothetical protein
MVANKKRREYINSVFRKQMLVNNRLTMDKHLAYLSGSGKFLDDLEMIQAVNIPVAPNKFHFADKGQVKRFTLIFPAIPKDWKEFCLVEMVDDRNIGFKSRKIRRNDTGIYNVFVE